ncbi:hypothetical protein F5888DRAFT_1569307, partial [Russula emetica]
AVNVIENVHLRFIFLMLNTELNDRDIPHRTKIRSQIMELWGLHVHNLGKEMRVFLNIFDRYQIQRIGWITLDNASNNDTLV